MSRRRILPRAGEGLPAMPQRGPYVVIVEAGRQYAWCSCGLSANQPWCDGAHRDTGFAPIVFEAPVSGEFHMCGCKQSQNKPYCFGTCRGHDADNSKVALW